MTLEAAHAALRQRFATGWGSTTPVQWPNQRFDIPETAWVRFVIEDADVQWRSMGDPGNNRERHIGQVVVQIFVPRGDGEGVSVEYADTIKAIFRGWQDATSGVRFRVPPYARQAGTERKWYQVNVVAPYEFDDFN